MTTLNARGPRNGHTWRIAAQFFVSIGLWLAGGDWAVAQLSNGQVTGVVTDQNASRVAGARVTLHNVATNVDRRGLTNEVGEYVFPQVPPGQYTLSAEKAGFKVSRIGEFTLNVNQVATIDIALQLGEVQQSINVETRAETIDVATAGLGGTIQQKQVEDLPLNGRNFTQLITLSPGVSPINVAQNGGGGEAAVAKGSGFVEGSINGQTNRSTFYLTDGIINLNSLFGTWGVAPIVDTLQEFKVNTHPDDAGFGGALGGTVNVVTKSGTNAVHGSAWEFVRNDAFDARNTFLSKVTPYRQNQFGFTVGGPVVLPKLYDGSNKTFFYGGMEWFRFRQPSNSLLLTPTPSELSGDLSDISTQIFNPFSTQPDPNKPGQFMRTPFPNNQIPASLINQGMIAYAKALWPAIQNVGVAGKNAIDPTPVVQNMRQYTFRVDQTIGTNNFVWFRLSDVNSNITQSGGLPSLRNVIDNPGDNYGASYVHVFSPTLLMQLQFGRLNAGQISTTRLTSGQSASVASAIGFASPFVKYASGDLLLPSITVTGYLAGGEQISLEPHLGDVYQFKGSVSKTHGAHTLAFGAEFDTTNYNSYYEYGFLTFANNETGNPEVTSQPGSALASFLLGVPDYAAQRNVHETFRPGGIFGAYVQDSWKVNRRLTVNLGLRYDLTLLNPYGQRSTAGQPGGINTGDLNLKTGIYTVLAVPPSCDQVGHAPCIPGGTLPANVVASTNGKLLNNTYTNLGPRLGIAYRLTPTTAIRAGFGILYDNWAGQAQRAQSFAGNWPDVALVILNGLNQPTAAQPTPSTTVTNPLGSTLPSATPFTRAQRYVDPNISDPYSMQWNFGVQHEFSRSTSIDIAYVGSGSRRLSVADLTNVAVTPGPGPIAPRQPFPNIVATNFETSSGNSSYNALQAQFRRRFEAGLQLQASYTWSKSIDAACSGFFGVEGCSVQDPYHTNLDRSVSGFDVPHLFVANAIYDLPFGRGKLGTGNRVADYLLHNWQVNTLVTARSGVPFSATYNGTGANTGNTSLRGQLVGDPQISNPTRQRWFNTGAFAIPALYTFGNAGRNILRSQTFWNVDLSAFRRFPFAEGRSVEFRAEAFNAPNTVVYGTPNGALATPAFGSVSSTANSARQLQLGLKVVF